MKYPSLFAAFFGAQEAMYVQRVGGVKKVDPANMFAAQLNSQYANSQHA